MKIVGYLRVSIDSQDINKQQITLLEYASQQQIHIDEFVEGKNLPLHNKYTKQQTVKDVFLDKLDAGDTLLINELSQLGDSLNLIVLIVDKLIKKKVHLIAIKENINLDGKQSTQTKVMVAMFSLFSEIVKNLDSRHMLETGVQGKLIGRPKGAWGKSRLDGREEEIKVLLRKKVSKSSIAKIMDVSRTALYHFVVSRELL